MIRISKKLRGYLERISRLAWAKISPETSDATFIQTIEAINTYCNLMDALDADRTELRAHMASLYPELIRRIYAKPDIQEACHLIECLYAFIYDRDIDECDRGPLEWRQALLEASLKAVMAYREHPQMHPLHYATLLRYYTVQSQDDSIYAEAVEEMRQLMNRQIETVSENLPDEELMQRIRLRQENAGGFMTPDKEKDLAWTEAMELLIQRVKVTTLSDEQLLLWIKVLKGMEQWYIDFVVPFDHLWPEAYRELRGRKSLAHNIEVLAYQAWDELQRLEEAEAKRALIQKEKEFKDDFLQEVLPIQIDETLSVESLLALHAIYLARYESVSLFYGEEENRIRGFCQCRHKEIYDQLARRLPQVDDIYTRIRILEAMRELEYRYGSLGTTRDTTNFVANQIETLLSQRDRLPETAIHQLLALRYADDAYEGMEANADLKNMKCESPQMYGNPHFR